MRMDMIRLISDEYEQDEFNRITRHPFQYNYAITIFDVIGYPVFYTDELYKGRSHVFCVYCEPLQKLFMYCEITKKFKAILKGGGRGIPPFYDTYRKNILIMHIGTYERMCDYLEWAGMLSAWIILMLQEKALKHKKER